MQNSLPGKQIARCEAMHAMSDSPDSLRESATSSPKDPAVNEEIRRCLDAEVQEMEKYKWCLGVHLQHDPLLDRTLNEIYCEWIDKYAADFRKDWEKRKQQGPEDNTES
jgi:hypothetical protein